MTGTRAQDLTALVRDAVAVTPEYAVIELPGGSILTLIDCATTDGVPIWDAPAGSVVDGQVELLLSDGGSVSFPVTAVPTWEALADRVLDPTAANTAEMLAEARRATDLMRSREADYRAARERARKAVSAAVAAGASKYRVAQETDLSQPTIARWTQS